MSGRLPPPADLLTPWHWTVIPETGPWRRFREENPSVAEVFARSDLTWQAAFAELVAQRATEAEIWAGGWRDLLPIAVRRYLEQLLDDTYASRTHGPRPTAPILDDSPSAVLAERERRQRAGEPSGYDALARHFHLSKSTIRRRLDDARGPRARD